MRRGLYTKKLCIQSYFEIRDFFSLLFFKKKAEKEPLRAGAAMFRNAGRTGSGAALL
jgi:hypothetical protein